LNDALPSAAVHDRPLGPDAPAAEAGRLAWGARILPWTALAAAAVLGLADPGITDAAAPWPFVIALVAFGMPHGAADWSVAAELNHTRGFLARLLGFTGYLALMAASLGLIMWQPGVSALLFLLLTVFHFGMADATAVHADHDGPVARWGLVLGRGLLLLATAFAAHPADAWSPFARIGEALSPWPHHAWQPDLARLQQLAVVGSIAGAVAATCSVIARVRAGHARAAMLDAVEHAMVATVAMTANPLFTVGCYFLGVHAFRHTRRLACTHAVIDAPDATRGRAAAEGARAPLIGRILRVHVLSLPLMWVTALGLVPLCWLLGWNGACTLAEASIALYMVTTLPHHLLGLQLPQPDMPPAA
jgi:Brp/Blh family beta-carotene 15,15'-monooxygenase